LREVKNQKTEVEERSNENPARRGQKKKLTASVLWLINWIN